MGAFNPETPTKPVMANDIPQPPDHCTSSDCNPTQPRKAVINYVEVMSEYKGRIIVPPGYFRPTLANGRRMVRDGLDFLSWHTRCPQCYDSDPVTNIHHTASRG